MANDIVRLNTLPTSDEKLPDWAAQITALIGADIREYEVAADQHCWRLSIQQKHWLLIYSAICEAAWLQSLEGDDGNIEQLVRKLGC